MLPFVAGALLPDVIDKSLYYSHVSSFISCTRTFGHTGLFVVLLAAIAWTTHSPAWAAVAVGAATHPLLDLGMDMLGPSPSSALIALTWPFLHTHFYSHDFTSPLEQLRLTFRPSIVITEAIGIALLVREYWTRSLRH